jgi:hypothetical protein
LSAAVVLDTKSTKQSAQSALLGGFGVQARHAAHHCRPANELLLFL